MADIDAKIVFKDKKAREFFEKMSQKADAYQDRSKAYADAIQIFVFKDIQDHFDKEMGPNGRWAPWSDSYQSVIAGEIHFIGRKGQPPIVRQGKHPNRSLPRKGDLSGLILTDTRALQRGLKPGNRRRRSEGIEWFNNAETRGGFPYAAHHDEGPSAADGSSRPFMWLSDDAMDKIAKTTLAFVLSEKG